MRSVPCPTSPPTVPSVALIAAALLAGAVLPVAAHPTPPTACDVAGVGPVATEQCRERWTAREDVGPTTGLPRQDGGYAIDVAPSGDRVAAAGLGDAPADLSAGSAMVVTYDAQTGERLWRTLVDRTGRLDLASGVAFGPEGETVYAVGRAEDTGGVRDAAIWAFDAATGAVRWSTYVASPAEGADSLGGVAPSPSGDRVVAFGEAADGTPSGPDLLTVAVDAATGDVVWEDRYDGPAGGEDGLGFVALTDVAMTPDGTAIVAGTSDGGPTGDDVAAIAYDVSTGERDWTTRFHVADDSSERATAVAYDAATDRAVVGGNTYHGGPGDNWLAVGLDADDGSVAWHRIYDGPAGSEYLATGVDAAGGRAFLGGMSMSDEPTSNGWAYAAVAYDAETGDRSWASYYSGGERINDVVWDLDAAPDGSRVAVTGESYGLDPTPLVPPYQVDIATVVFDGASGDRLGAARYTPDYEGWDAGQAVAFGPDGSGLYATGISPDPDRTSDLPVLAYDLPMPDPLPVSPGLDVGPTDGPSRKAMCVERPGPSGALEDPLCDHRTPMEEAASGDASGPSLLFG